MRIAIISIFLLSFLSCKKNNHPASNTTSADKTKIVSPKADPVISVQPKQEMFQFVTELCDNKGYFDSNKYSREEIEGTYKLWFELSGSLLNTPFIHNLKDLNEIRNNTDQVLAKLEKDFAEKKAQIMNLKIVNVPYWQNVKKKNLESLAQTYEMEKTQLIAYSDPSILLKNNTCSNFSKALNSTDEQMFAEWKKLREEMSKNNGNPQRIINQFNEQLNSSDKRDYAIIDLITFGWGNCANDKIQRVSHDEKMNNEFNALFIKIDSECDEP
ncbi:hypothetical protein H5J24_00515 [Chryseobacterium capnotolerans]|uniref:hypothetical protein n=1 Tax=Chryseobacterium TaxID=59732 RepID=UPI00083B10B6|nr:MULTISPECIES: hypothetical protein [Chryseobacterium]UHO38720.1 hypothetical protein H5J24_00515 [Chryseobacterium capnotolerans]